MQATQQLYSATDTFLGHHQTKVPYIIGIAGSVAVGKSTTARILQTLLARWPSHPKVDLITTDGFLYPNRVLEERGLMRRKGFPESYDQGRLVRFLLAVKSGETEVPAPTYSHYSYDIVEGRFQVVKQPDIVIVEGLNVLQTGNPGASPRRFVSDFFDFSVYVDAPAELIERWYVERFTTFRQTVFTDPAVLLPPLRPSLGRNLARDRPRHLGRDQRRQPARQHRADQGKGPSHPRERPRPRGGAGAFAAALMI